MVTDKTNQDIEKLKQQLSESVQIMKEPYQTTGQSTNINRAPVYSLVSDELSLKITFSHFRSYNQNIEIMYKLLDTIIDEVVK
jgi:hypothetical protein